MAKKSAKDNEWPKGVKFSGRTIAFLFAKTKKGSNEAHNRKLRIKNQLKPTGRDRFPEGYKYTTLAGTPVR